LDWVRSNSRKWTPFDLAHVLGEISKKAKVSHFIIISDDPNLPRLTKEAIEARKKYHGNSIAVTFTTESVLHAARTDRDCLRDQLGCDENLNVQKAAFANMVDLALVSMCHVFAGTEKSMYSRLLDNMVMYNVQRPLLLGVEKFDLDAVCAKNQRSATGGVPCNLYLP
jgi:hypothetical protein